MNIKITSRKIIITIAIILLIMSPIVLYALHMGDSLSTKNEDWGDFGSFIGGIYGSFFSSLSLIIVLWATIESKRSSSEQLKILKNDSYSSEFNLLINHLSKIKVSRYQTFDGRRFDIERHLQDYKITLSLSAISDYKPELTPFENLTENGIEYYKKDERNIFEKDSKVLVCILKLIKKSSLSSSEAFKIIFETTFSEEYRLCLEHYTRAHYGEDICQILNEWPRFSSIPKMILRQAKRNYEKNKEE